MFFYSAIFRLIAALICFVSSSTRQDTDEENDELQKVFAVEPLGSARNLSSAFKDVSEVVSPHETQIKASSAPAAANKVPITSAPKLLAKVRAFVQRDIQSHVQGTPLEASAPKVETTAALATFGLAALMAACLLFFFVSADIFLKSRQQSPEVETARAASLTAEEGHFRYKVVGIAYAARSLATTCTWSAYEGDADGASPTKATARFVAVEPECRDERRPWSQQFASWQQGRVGLWPNFEAFASRRLPDEFITLNGIEDVTLGSAATDQHVTITYKPNSMETASVGDCEKGSCTLRDDFNAITAARCCTIGLEDSDKATLWHDTLNRIRTMTA